MLIKMKNAIKIRFCPIQKQERKFSVQPKFLNFKKNLGDGKKFREQNMKSFRWRQGQKVIKIYVLLSFSNNSQHGLQTPREEIAFTARPKIKSQIFRYGRSRFCLSHRPNFSNIFDLCLHWVSVFLDLQYVFCFYLRITFRRRCLSCFQGLYFVTWSLVSF